MCMICTTFEKTVLVSKYCVICTRSLRGLSEDNRRKSLGPQISDTVMKERSQGSSEANRGGGLAAEAPGPLFTWDPGRRVPHPTGRAPGLPSDASAGTTETGAEQAEGQGPRGRQAQKPGEKASNTEPSQCPGAALHTPRCAQNAKGPLCRPRDGSASSSVCSRRALRPLSPFCQ